MKALIHWASFGHYHRARFRAATEWFAGRGHELIGLATARSSETYAWDALDGLSDLGVTTVFPRHAYFEISKPTLWREMFSALDRLQPEVLAIAGYSLQDALAALAWCKLRRRRAVLLSESKADDATPSRLRWRIKSRLVRMFDAALCGGTSHRDYLLSLGMPSSRIYSGYNVIDNDYFATESERHRAAPADSAHLPGLEVKTPYFLASNRFIPRKNLSTLISAFRQFRESSRCQWRLILLGNGPEEARLREQVRNQVIPDVIFAGFRQAAELPAYYAHAGAFIHPAAAEQWGLVVNEAMAAGLPVLVSERAGCAQDLVQSGLNGFTFAPHDAEELARLMQSIAETPELAGRMGQASRRIIAHWRPAAFAEGLFSAVSAATHLNFRTKRTP